MVSGDGMGDFQTSAIFCMGGGRLVQGISDFRFVLQSTGLCQCGSGFGGGGGFGASAGLGTL